MVILDQNLLSPKICTFSLAFLCYVEELVLQKLVLIILYTDKVLLQTKRFVLSFNVLINTHRHTETEMGEHTHAPINTSTQTHTRLSNNTPYLCDYAVPRFLSFFFLFPSFFLSHTHPHMRGHTNIHFFFQ